MLSQERLIDILSYDPLSGSFMNLTQRGKRGTPGKIAGYVNPLGYRVIRIDSENHHAHRLVWLYQYGNFPDYLIDHIHGNRDDNRLINLRPATYKQNAENQKLHSVNKSGHRGVSWDNHNQLWVACVVHMNERLRKRFKNMDDAIKAVKQMRDELYTHHRTEYSA